MKYLLLYLLGYLLFSCSSQPKDVQEEVDKDEAIRTLGQLLFFEERMSKDKTVSCASCHLPQLAFTDGLVKSKGIEGRTAFRNAPTLFNMDKQTLFMFDGVIESLEIQALSPIHDENEMGSNIALIIERLKDDKVFKKQCDKAYGRPLDAKAITESLAAYQRSLVSLNSPYDAFLSDSIAHPLQSDAREGLRLFTDKFKCIECHSGIYFTNHQPESNGIVLTQEDQGRYRATGKEEDRGKFKVPTLRNIAKTAPYMHDGRFATLEDVMHFYAGLKEKHGHELVKKYRISAKEQEQLIAFLKALTDDRF